MKNYYFSKLCNYKHRIMYLSLYLELLKKIDVIITVFLEIASVVAVSVWLREYISLAFLAAIVTFLDIVPRAVKVLPIKNIIAILNKLIPRLSIVYDRIELSYMEMKNSNLDDEHISNLISYYSNEWDTIENDLVGEEVLPLNNKLIYESYYQAVEYIENNLLGGR